MSFRAPFYFFISNFLECKLKVDRWSRKEIDNRKSSHKSYCNFGMVANDTLKINLQLWPLCSLMVSNMLTVGFYFFRLSQFENVGYL